MNRTVMPLEWLMLITVLLALVVTVAWVIAAFGDLDAVRLSRRNGTLAAIAESNVWDALATCGIVMVFFIVAIAGVLTGPDTAPILGRWARTLGGLLVVGLLLLNGARRLLARRKLMADERLQW